MSEGKQRMPPILAGRPMPACMVTGKPPAHPCAALRDTLALSALRFIVPGAWTFDRDAAGNWWALRGVGVAVYDHCMDIRAEAVWAATPGELARKLRQR